MPVASPLNPYTCLMCSLACYGRRSEDDEFAPAPLARRVPLGALVLTRYIRHSPYSDLAIPISQTGAFGVRLGFGAGRVGGAGRLKPAGTRTRGPPQSPRKARRLRREFPDHGSAFPGNRFGGVFLESVPRFPGSSVSRNSNFRMGPISRGGLDKKPAAIHFGQVAT